MSFSATVKEELARVISPGRHCQIAEMAAIMSFLGRVESCGDREVITLQTENEAVARKCFTLLRKTFNIDTEILVQKKVVLKKGSAFTVELREPKDVLKVLQGTKLVRDPDTGCCTGKVDSLVFQRSCCRRAFIRGAFLSAGSISTPEKGYHFEIVCASDEKALVLQDIIRSFGIEAKVVRRKKSHVVYVKEGSQIVDLLAVMEAGQSVMNMENIRITKEVRNNVNRKVNCETANINKTVEAAVKQTEDIRLIESVLGLDYLKGSLREIAELRLQYPEASLQELGSMLTLPVGKSGANHRFRRISELAESLRNGKVVSNKL